MLKSLRPIVLVACTLTAFPSWSAPSPKEAAQQLVDRFAEPAYLVGNSRVATEVRRDAIVVQTTASAAALQTQLANKGISTQAPVRLRSDLFRVDGLMAKDHNALVAIAQQIEGLAGVVRVYPALARFRRGEAYTTDALIVSATHGQLERVLARVLPLVDGQLIRRAYVADTALISVGAKASFDARIASRRLAEAKIDDLRSAEPNVLRQTQTRRVTDDPMLPQQWHLLRSEGDTTPGTGTIHADAAWDVTLGDPGTVIAVFDSGIDITHPDLVDNLLSGFDAATGDNDPSPECSADAGGGAATDCPQAQPYRESHGTSVSGTAAGRGDNALGTTGVCPLCSILPVRLLGGDASDGLSTAEAFVRAVDLGADIINNSWGPGAGIYFPMSTAENDAWDHARTVGRDGKGTVIVFAAGNDTSNVAGDPYAAHPYTIAVAASTNVDDWAPYSNYGFEIDIAAPSQGLPAAQDGYADDDPGIVTTDNVGQDGYSAGDYNPGFSGTSAASPVTAGVLGLLLSAHPDITAEQARLMLTSTAERIVAGAHFPLEQIFPGVAASFAYDDNAHSTAFGYGRVDAARAVGQQPPQQGGVCTDACAACTSTDPDGRCLMACTAQADCVVGSLCSAAGVCELPLVKPTDVGAPCSPACETCAPAIDTAFEFTEICSRSCDNDDACPLDFDCRIRVAGEPGVCVPGSPGAGQTADGFNCYVPLISGPMTAMTGDGRELCVDVCLSGEDETCPYGMGCRTADCDCATPDCFSLLCREDDEAGRDATDFDAPVCMPNPEYGDRCSIDMDCLNGDYCKDGVCAVDDRAGCDVCESCDADEDCMGRGRCRGRQGGNGKCIWSCDIDAQCPGDSVCRLIDSFGGTQQLACVSPEGGTGAADRCDASYTCSTACPHVPCAQDEVCDVPTGECVAAHTDDPSDDTRNDEDQRVKLTAAGGAMNCTQTPATSALWAVVLLLAMHLRRRR